MPTFLVLKGSKVVETVRGANPSALRSAVLSAATDAAKGPAGHPASFSGKGQTLGGEGSSSRPSSASLMNFNVSQMFTAPAAFAQGRGLPQQIVRVIGLYLSTLLSFEPIRTAETSPFAVRGGRKFR
jgi:hypothetical protein